MKRDSVDVETPVIPPWSKLFGTVTILEIVEYKLDHLLDLTKQLSESKEKYEGDAPLDADRKQRVIGFLERMVKTCEELELWTTKGVAEAFINTRKPMTGADVAIECATLLKTLQAECKTVIFYRVAAVDREKLEQKTPLFGQEVADAFPSAAYDISEAGKCFALGRSTASVFHLMKPMEIALQALAGHVGATMPNILQWGFIEGAIKKMNSTDSFVIEAMPLFSSVKIAWRNPAMHVALKYTPEEALAIFNAVKGFMRHLATKLHE